MKFKRALSVFIDNFKTTYKLLLYKAVILVVFGLLYTAVIYPMIIYPFLDSAQLSALVESIGAFLENLFNGEVAALGELSAEIKVAFDNFVLFLGTLTANIFWGIIIVFVIFIIQNFLMDLGNFTAAAIINDKMQLQAKSPFINTFIKNFTRACAFASVYAPLNVIYNVVAILLSYVVFFMLCGFLPILLQVLLFVSFAVFAVSFKKAHLAGWLPSIISGKMKIGQAFKNSLEIAKKDRWTLVSDFVILNLIIMAVVTSTAVFTLGAATVIAAPASAILLYSYKFVNYFTENDVKYFVDETTIVKPKKEHKLTREEFFKGEQ